MSPDAFAEAKRPALPGGSPTDATAGVDPQDEAEDDEDVAIGEIFDPFERDSGPKPETLCPMEPSMRHQNSTNS